MIPIAPTIPPDEEFTTNSTRIQKIINELESPKYLIPNGSNYSTLENGILRNINDPVEDQQASTLSYALANVGGATPGGPQSAIQFNDNGTFNGQSDFTYNDLSKVMTVDTLTNGSLTIGNGTITGLPFPTLPNQAASKAYAENSLTITRVSLNSLVPVVYTPAQMINSIIERDITGTAGTLVDTTADAVDIINFSGGNVNTTYHFMIKNTSTDLNSVLQINPGVGVTIKSSVQNIYPGYQYTTQLKITSPTTVDILILNNNFALVSENFNYRYNKTLLNVGVIQATDYMLEWTYPNEEIITITEYAQTEFGLAISIAQIVEQKVLTTQVITGNLANDPVDNNRVVIRNNATSVTGKVFNGSFEFYLCNPAASSDPLLIDFTKVGQDYTSDPYSIYEIPPGQTGWFLLTYDDNASTGTIYTIGIFDTV